MYTAAPEINTSLHTLTLHDALPISPLLTTSPGGTATVRHEFSFLNAVRLVQALVYAGLAFSPPDLGWPQLSIPDFARSVAALYLLFALVMLLFNRRSMPYARSVVAATLVVDIAAAVLAIAAMHDARIGIAMMLAVNRSEEHTSELQSLMRISY